MPALAAITWLTLLILAPSEVLAQSGDRALMRAQNVVQSAPAARVALVIGNGAYEHTSPLAAPEQDASDMATALEAMGFEVRLLVDAKRGEMETAIRDFGDQLESADVQVAFAYFSGHGVQVDGANFLIPVDADVQRANELPSEAVDLNFILTRMPATPGRLNVVVLDACRNNPFVGTTRAGTRGLAQVSTASGTLLAYATSPGMVAADTIAPGDRNSPYTAALLEQLPVPGRKVEDVFKAVRREVSVATNNKQVPWESTAVIGDFYFVPPDVTAAWTEPNLATLTVYSERGGEVRLNGESFGVLEPFKEIVLGPLLPGAYVLHVGELYRDVILGAGEESRAEFLVPRPLEQRGVPLLTVGSSTILLGLGAASAALLIASPGDMTDDDGLSIRQATALKGLEILGYGVAGAGLGLVLVGGQRAAGLNVRVTAGSVQVERTW